jgi:heme/copper-type cytochrome/quinol oxidase subunit 2
MNKNSNKLITIQCLSLTDIGLAIYTYFAISNFQEFKKILIASVQVDSPEMQLELYKVFMQTLLFISVVLVVFHLIIYYFYFKEKKYAVTYVKYYSLLAGVSMFASTLIMNQLLLLLPSLAYSYAFYNSLKHSPLKNNSKTTV